MTTETTMPSGTSPPSGVILSASQQDSGPLTTPMPPNNVSSSTIGKIASSELKRRGSEAMSEGSGSSSIRFIDQVSVSGGSSTETLPDINAGYLDTGPLSPELDTESCDASIETTSENCFAKANNSKLINNVDFHKQKCEHGSARGTPSTVKILTVDNDVRSASPVTDHSICSVTKCTNKIGTGAMGSGGGGDPGGVSRGGNGTGGRWRRKLLLLLRSSGLSNSNNAPSPMSVSNNLGSTRSTSSSKRSNYTLLKSIPDNRCTRNRRIHDKSVNNVSDDDTTSNELRTSPLASFDELELPSTIGAQPETEEVKGQTLSNVDNPINTSPSVLTSSANGEPSLENGFGDIEYEFGDDSECYNRVGTETDEGSSLPSSPIPLASATGTPSQPTPVATYYGFLSVNGGTMRQETTSTSSPQLSSSAGASSAETLPPVNDIAGSLIGEGPTNVGTSLKPDSLEAACCLPAARSCPNLEQQSAGCSSTSSSSNTSLSPGLAGPRFKPLDGGDIQLCYLNHTRTFVNKILSSKFLRRWEAHRLYLTSSYLSSNTLTGFLQQPIPYSSMLDVYVVVRLDPRYRYWLRIVLPDGSLLLQASNAYTCYQWYHSILWKKSIFKYQHVVSVNTRKEIILRELKTMVDFALRTPLQDERVYGTPLEAVAQLLAGKESIESDDSHECIQRSWAEAVLGVAAPLLEKAAPAPTLAQALSRLAERHPRSSLVMSISPAITRCLKHTVDFSKSQEMRKLLQAFIAALYENNDGEQSIRDYIASVHGPGSDCPHPRILPNLISVCVAAISHRFDAISRKSSNTDDTECLPPLRCYLVVLKVASEYADWRPGLGALLQPVPFPECALTDSEVQEAVLLSVMRRLTADRRCSVHQALLPVREVRPGWIHIAAPSSNDACPDEGALFGEMLTTLLGCCCRRKKFVASLVEQTWGACMLLGVRRYEAAQEALCLMLEWRLLPNEEHRLQVVSALQSTETGKNRYDTLCRREKNLQELQQKGGPKKLTLPARATDADVAVILGGGALGNLECLTLAFTSVTSACAEQLIKLPALRYLNLWATQFGDAGLQMISEHLQRLQVLNLCETPVSDKGISTLASLTSLRKLNLNSTKLSAQTFESLKKRLPALQEFDVRYTEAW